MNLQVVQFQHGPEFLKPSYSQFVQPFQDVIRWDFRHWQEYSVPLRIEFLNIIISWTDSEQVCVVFDRIISPNDREVIVDQVNNLSAAKETVLLLGLLFLQTDSSFWNGNYGWSCSVLKQFSHQEPKNWQWNTSKWRRSQFIHWINQLHFFDPLHRFRRKLWTNINFSLESFLPASKRTWCRELVKMEIRNLQSLLVHNSLKSFLQWKWLNFLADGPDKHLWSWPCAGLSLFSTGWVKWLFGRGTPCMDSIPAD